jgi:hypothetical protein
VKAGTHFDLDFPASIFRGKSKMDSGFRRNDENGGVVRPNNKSPM